MQHDDPTSIIDLFQHTLGKVGQVSLNLSENTQAYINRYLNVLSDFVQGESSADDFLVRYKDLNSEEKLGFLLDLIIYHLLKEDIDPDNEVALIPRTFISQTDENKPPVGQALDKILLAQDFMQLADQALKKAMSANLKASERDTWLEATKKKWQLLSELVTVRQRLPEIAQRLSIEHEASIRSPIYIQQTIEGYIRDLHQQFKSRLSAVNHADRAKIYYLLQSTIVSSQNIQNAMLQRYFANVAAMAPKSSEEAVLRAQYASIFNDFKKIVALNDLKQEASLTTIVRDHGLLFKLETLLNDHTLPKYAEKASVTFYEKMAAAFAGVNLQFAREIAPLAEKNLYFSDQETGKQDVAIRKEQNYRLEQFIREVEQYRNTRDAEAKAAGKDVDHHYLSRFSSIFQKGMSAGLKLKASKGLLSYLYDIKEDPESPLPDLGKLELQALRAGRLGDIVKKYKDILPANFKNQLEGKIGGPKFLTS